eukprot:2190603-Ditylum_brightwellii.AAC.1
MAVKSMPLRNKYIALNTLMKLMIPDTKALDGTPRQVSDGPTWQSSGLLGFQKDVHVVWVAKGNGSTKPFIYVHFVGS